MNPKDCFGIVVRTLGLLLCLAGLYHVLFGLLLMSFGNRFWSDTVLLAAFTPGLPATFAGLYLLRGAPALMAFCYPASLPHPDTPDNALRAIRVPPERSRVP